MSESIIKRKPKLNGTIVDGRLRLRIETSDRIIRSFDQQITSLTTDRDDLGRTKITIVALETEPYAARCTLKG